METLLLPLLLLAVFYFILIRPQQKQRREIAQLQSTIAPGARVMTGSGLVATVVAVDDDEVVLEVAPGVTNRYVRRAIVRILPEETASPAQPMTDESVPEPITETVTDEATSGTGTDRTNRDDGPGTST